MGLRIVREPCKCCQTGRPCCEFGIHAPLPFTPEWGWDIESIDVSNGGQHQCVGRAVAEIILTRPADPLPDCDGSADDGCGRNCRDGFHGSPSMMYPGADMAETLALFNDWLMKFPLPAGWVKTDVIGTVRPWYNPPGIITAPICDDWFVRELVAAGPSTNCSGECASTTKNLRLFTYDVVNPAERYYSTQAARDAFVEAKGDAFEAAWDTWWASDAPPIRWQKGDCEYELTPNRAGPAWTGINYRGCTKYIPGNPANMRWVACEVHVQSISNLSTQQLRSYWTVRCTSSPCTMPDYDWPLMLPCACTAEYEKAGVSGTPDCALYLDSTRREYHDATCRFIARYAGAIEAGEIECLPGSTLPDCVCCDEGQA